MGQAITVSVLIPFGGDDPNRKRLLRWVRTKYHLLQLGERLEVVVGQQHSEGPWRKGEAYADALNRSTGDVVVLTDADVWIPRLPEAVAALREGLGAWVRGVDSVKRISQRSTESVLHGTGLGPLLEMDEQTYTHDAAGAGTVLWRSDACRIPVDPRFEGWGHEDSAYALALTTLAGESYWMNDSPCWHLWHEPQQRQTRRRGSDESWRLWRRYQKANGDVGEMLSLVYEAAVSLETLRSAARSADRPRPYGALRPLTGS